MPIMFSSLMGSLGKGSLRNRLFAVVLVVLLLGGALGTQSAQATSYDAEELRFLTLINDYRQSNGLRPLILSDTLAVAAERHSEDMGERNFFAHDTVSSSYYPAGSEPWDRMKAEGYAYNTYKGENLAAGYDTAEEAMQAWKVSPAHNAAMLDGNYKVVGIARVSVPGSNAGWYWTTDFGGFVDPSSHAPGQASGSGGRSDDPTEDQQQDAKPEPGTDKTAAPRPDRDLGDIENGSMQWRTVWDQQSQDGADLFVDGHARLGGYNKGEDELRQRIRVGSGQELSYKIRVKTDEQLHPFDGLRVRLVNAQGRQIAVLRRHTDAGARRWHTEQADLSRFDGRTVFLSFYATTDRVLPTTFYVDDVRVANEAGPNGGPPPEAR